MSGDESRAQPDSAAPGLDWARERGRGWRRHLDALEAMLAPVDEPIARALELDRPLRIADVGCGGGGAAMARTRRAPKGSAIHGFGVMFFDAPSAAFANLRRWLAPEGRFAFAVWAPIEDNPWMKALRDTMASHVSTPPPEPDAPGPFRYAPSERLISLLAAAGFDHLAARDWRGELELGGGLGAEDAATFALSSFSIAAALNEAGAGIVDEARADLMSVFSAFEREGAVKMPARAHIVTGVAASG